MTALSSTTPTTHGITSSASTAPVASRAGGAPAAPQSLELRMSRPSRDTTVVHVTGELDTHTAPRLHELLATRLRSTVEAIVLDLSGLHFLGVDGLELLSHARCRAQGRRIDLRLVGGPVCVRRALRAGGLGDELPLHDDVGEALASVPDREDRTLQVVA